MSAASGPTLRAEVSRAGSAVVVALTGELDIATAEPLRHQLTGVVDGDPPPARVVVDAAALDFVDAAGISVLLGAQQALAARGGELLLRAPSRLVLRVVAVLQLDGVLLVEA